MYRVRSSKGIQFTSYAPTVRVCMCCHSLNYYLRATYAEYSLRRNQQAGHQFVVRAQDFLGINFSMFQTDNGGEFGT